MNRSAASGVRARYVSGCSSEQLSLAAEARRADGNGDGNDGNQPRPEAHVSSHRRCGNVYPHRFRHHFSHAWLDRGGAEGDLMELNGWASPQMLRRYGASARSTRARRSYDRIMDPIP
jgi:integrase